MTEYVLPYDASVVPQTTSWDCGPAATQVVLNALGIIATENTLIAEIRTTTNGTDDVSWIETRSLDLRVPQANYTTVYLRNDPPSAAQIEAFWARATRSINAGYGVILNWDSPASNPPRAIKGSTSPSGYGSREIFHYVAAMGYDDNYDGKGGRAIWIADPGFSPFGYWITLQQCVGLITPKGYCYADVATSGSPTTSDVVALLAQVMDHRVSTERYAALAPAVSQCLQECGCTTSKRIAMWVAQIGHESGGLLYMEEIASGAAYEGRTDLGNTQPGDGVRFKGRGPVQVTGRGNYSRLSQWAYGKGLVPTSTFFIDNPGQLASDTYGFIGVTWYWTTQQDMNRWADAGDIENGSKAINAPAWIGRADRRANGIADRITYYNRALALGDQLLALTTGGDDFMSALTPDEQREMLELLRQQAKYRRKSTSAFRWPGEGEVNTCAGFAWSGDGNTHVGLVEKLAVEYGDPQHVAMLQATALCAQNPKAYPDRQDDAILAARVLTKVEPSAAAAGKAYLQAWFDAEKK